MGDRPIFLVAIETLEPLCSIWMLATHHLGVVDVFIGAAVMTLLGAAVWFTCLHAPNNCCSKNPPEKSKKRDTSPSHRGGKGAQDRSGDSYTQVGNVAQPKDPHFPAF